MERLAERYKTIETVKVGEKEISVLDIKLMSDEKWQELAIENAISNYTKVFGHAPASTEIATQWQWERVNKMMEKVGA